MRSNNVIYNYRCEKKKKCTFIWDGSNATNQDSVFPHLAVGLRLVDAPNSLVA